MNTDKIIEWAHARNIIEGSTPIQQHGKLLEEVIELRDALVGDAWTSEAALMEDIVDGIGDSLVVLTIIAEMQGVTLEQCLDHAYEQIKHRTGRMVNGVFLKDR